MNLVKLCLVLAAAAIFAVACSQTATTPNTAKANNTAPTAANNNKAGDSPSASATPAVEIADGKQLYATHCMICHQESGKGGKVTVEGKQLEPDDLTGAKMKAKSDEKLTEYVVDGAPDDGMPAFKGKLTDAQIKALVKHMRTLQGV